MRRTLRKATGVPLGAGLLVAPAIAASAAATLDGTPGDDSLVGTAAADEIRTGAGDDFVIDLGGDDVLLLGGLGADFAGLSQGADHVFLGAGDDEVKLADDGTVDPIRCGDGLDTVTYYGAIDMLDALADCEDVSLAE